jgi:anti-sigma regulatory factor (Ser/Thr protein kinase)
MDDRLTLRLRNHFDEIPAANDTANEWLEYHAIPPSAAYLANLAIEELSTNCIKYGYSDQEVHLITVELEKLPHELILTFIDDGNAFDPLQQLAPDTTLPVEDRPIGGLGLHLLRQMSDDFAYARINEKNQVTLRKKLT